MGKREALLDAAVRLFTSRGFQETTTAQISREAGVATGTLFNYFAGKSDLIHQLFLHCRNSMATALRIQDTRDVHFPDAFRELLERGVRWGLEHPQMFWFFEQYRISPYAAELTVSEGPVHFQFILEFLKRGIENGDIRPAPPELLYTLVISATSAVVAAVLGEEENRDRYVSDTYAILWEGLDASR